MPSAWMVKWGAIVAFQDQSAAAVTVVVRNWQAGRRVKQSMDTVNRRRTLTPFDVHLTSSELSRITEIQRLEASDPHGRSGSFGRADLQAEPWEHSKNNASRHGPPWWV